MKRLQMTLAHTSIAVLLVVSPLLAWTGVLETLAAADQGSSPRSAAYREAQRALDNKDWVTAEELFAGVAAGGDADADAALYWQAFAQLKRGRKSAATRTLAELERSYPDSPWIDDAKALAIEARSNSESTETPVGNGDEELKLYALNSLLQVQSERAVPILDEFLAGNHSLELKEKALFVLSQSGSVEAREVLVAIAKGQRQPELAMEAIEYLGLSGGKETAELLQQIYDATTDREVKEGVLEAMMLGGHRDRIVAAARGEGDAKLRSEAVELLGVMGATEELRQLYSNEVSVEVKKGILEGMFLAGDVEMLAGLATSEKDPKLRAEAIEGLGLIGSSRAGEALQRLWASESDHKIKEAILEAFFLQGNTAALIDIVRTEQDSAVRKEALEYLSMIGSDEAVEFLLGALEE